MTLNRYAARRDANEPALKAAAEKLGWWLTPIDEPVDFIGMFRSCGIFKMIEIKTPKGQFRPNQKAFMSEAAIRGCPVLVWRTLDDIVRDSP